MQSDPISSRISFLQEEIQAGNDDAVVAFWSEIETIGTPLVEPIEDDDQHVFVTFLWRGDEETTDVSVVTMLEGHFTQHQLTLIAKSDVWYKTYRVHSATESFYVMSPNDPVKNPLLAPSVTNPTANWRNDPLNHRFFSMPRKNMDSQLRLEYEFAPASSFSLPNAPKHIWATPQPNIPLGRIKRFLICSQALDNTRRIWVYTPPSYSIHGEKYPLLLLFDGRIYFKTIPIITILNNLIHSKRIPPLVAVLVDALDAETREQELTCSESFLEFIIQDIMPWTSNSYHITDFPKQRIVGGVSYGGLFAAFAALRYPYEFGNVLANSGSFTWKPDQTEQYEWIIQQFANRNLLPIKFYLDVGILEFSDFPGSSWPADEPSPLETVRHMKDTLLYKGYQVSYQEYIGGHDYYCWHRTVADGLIALIGNDEKR